MIKEWLATQFTQSVDGAAKLGLDKELIAIRARYERNKRNWKPHLNATKRVINEAVDKAEKDRTLMILGAGDCLDVPISTISRHRAGAHLVDIAQTMYIRRRLRKISSIGYILHDVTGFVDDKQEDARLPKLRRRPALVVSCNMASQLYLPFVNFPPQDDDDQTIMRVIVEDHVNMLKKFPGPTLMISDYEKHIIDGGEETIHTTLPLDLVGEPSETWRWDICPHGEIGPDTSAFLNVGVWHF